MDEKTLQGYQAEKENVSLVIDGVINEPTEIDDHATHINEHICFILSNDFKIQQKEKPELETKLLEHIRKHKMFNQISKQIENIEKE